MPNKRPLFTRLPGRGGVLALAGAIGIAAALLMTARRGAPDNAPKSSAQDAVQSISMAAGPEPLRTAAPRAAIIPESPRPELPKEIFDAIENGSQEPLTPPVIHVDIELATGSVPTSEPLVPKAISVDAEPAPGSVSTGAPLVPPTIDAFAAPPGH
jgi:hypothetical protein